MERRQQTRYPFTCDVESLPLRFQGQATDSQSLSGKVVDVSEHGARVIGQWPFEPLAMSRWRFHFPDTPVPITVLAQVRWIEPLTSQANTFHVGLLFVV
jgi:hypothetical protein